MANELFTRLSVVDKDRIIEMAWEDRTPFEAINLQFHLNEADVIELMRRELKRSSFNLWRKRVNSGVSHKHRAKRNACMQRLKAPCSAPSPTTKFPSAKSLSLNPTISQGPLRHKFGMHLSSCSHKACSKNGV